MQIVRVYDDCLCFVLIFFPFPFVRRGKGGVDVVGTEDGKLLSTHRPSIDWIGALIAANADRAVPSGKSHPSTGLNWASSRWITSSGAYLKGCLFVSK